MHLFIPLFCSYKLGYISNKKVCVGIYIDRKGNILSKRLYTDIDNYKLILTFDFIEWPNEADIDPETLYEGSIPYNTD